MSSAFRTIILVGAHSALLSNVVMGASVSLSSTLESFYQSPDFSLVATDVKFRFFEMATPAGANASTHILIDGLEPVADGSAILSSDYRGIDISTGNVYDIGKVYLELPSAPAGDGASSPIVGIVARNAPTDSSGWSAYTASGVAGALDGASGTISFDDADDSGSMSFSFSAGTTFQGSAAYEIVDDSTINVDGFALSDGSTTYNVSPFQLVMMNGEWYSFLLTDAADYDSLMYELRLATTVDVPTWGGFIFLSNWGTGQSWYSWHFKWVYEGDAGGGHLSGEYNIYWLQDLNRWVFIDPNSGKGSLAGFWMWVFDMPGVGGGSWVYTGTEGWGLHSNQPNGGYGDVEFSLFCAANGKNYFFTEYEDAGEYNNAPATAGNYFSTLPPAAVEYFKVQEPINDITGVEIPDNQLPAPAAP